MLIDGCYFVIDVCMVVDGVCLYDVWFDLVMYDVMFRLLLLCVGVDVDDVLCCVFV